MASWLLSIATLHKSLPKPLNSMMARGTAPRNVYLPRDTVNDHSLHGSNTLAQVAEAAWPVTVVE